MNSPLQEFFGENRDLIFPFPRHLLWFGPDLLLCPRPHQFSYSDIHIITGVRPRRWLPSRTSEGKSRPESTHLNYQRYRATALTARVEGLFFMYSGLLLLGLGMVVVAALLVVVANGVKSSSCRRQSRSDRVGGGPEQTHSSRRHHHHRGATGHQHHSSGPGRHHHHHDHGSDGHHSGGHG